MVLVITSPGERCKVGPFSRQIRRRYLTGTPDVACVLQQAAAQRYEAIICSKSKCSPLVRTVVGPAPKYAGWTPYMHTTKKLASTWYTSDPRVPIHAPVSSCAN